MTLLLALAIFLQPDLPAWMNSKQADHWARLQARHNDAVYNVPALARDLNAVAVGHAIAYEDLVRGEAETLETKTYDRIWAVLKRPPRLMPDEATISPTFVRHYGTLQKVFDWAHTLHAQTVDVLADRRMSDSQKDKEIERLWVRYNRAPFAITGLPLNMEHLDGRPHSGAFRKRFPRVNGLFWGYHWLQGAMYDMLYRTPWQTHQPQYKVIGERYHAIELLKTDREFMPMFAEVSPRFAKRFPHIANAFDNLHMLHDRVNDALAANKGREWTENEIDLAIWEVLSSTHHKCKPGEGETIGLHDHRHPMGMPGMGMMKGSDEETMYMPGMGWMRMWECAHCSVPLPSGDNWGASVTANGWTMLVRCIMCARDMAAETIGKAIIRAATEDPDKTLVLISDEMGNLTSNISTVVFLEQQGEHPTCHRWSRAFTSASAFDRYVRENAEYAGEKPISLEDWSGMSGGKPETFRRIERPNPYRS
ncbi:MAG: hypothetical protein HUU60_02580 [Armatimonadetes bacterium]|nr:hypothetical protein [Armatimonadota bacterium]